jgi:hypothetical protein
MTDAVDVVATPPVDRRSTDLTLARIHLRTGSLALARAEFETLAGREELDDDALIDLADVRWRTGDLAKAGAAATTALDRGIEAPVAMIIAAESAYARGRPGEARQMATRAMTVAGGTLDALFGGMPRSPVWPPDPAEPAPSAVTLFGDDAGDAIGSSGEVIEERRREDRRRSVSGPVPATAAAIAAQSVDPAAPGLWDPEPDDEAEAAAAEHPGTRPAAMLDAGLQALAAGDTDRAATLLGVAVRIGPHLAPTILDATIDAGAPALLLVRGDALRATGHEADATEAYAAAAIALGADVVPDPATPDEDVAVPYGPTDPDPQ